MIRINLLPARVSRKKAAGKQQLILFALILVAGVLANFLWAQSRSSDLKGRMAKMAKTQEEIAQLDRIIGEVKNIKEQQAALREKLDTLNVLKAGRSGPVRVMDVLASVTPKRLWISKLEEKGGAATITGQAATIDDVSEFMTALKGTPYFSGVELKRTAAASSTAKAGLDLVDFTLTAQITYAPRSPAAPAAVSAPKAR
jgi:type IV pilus assembly protein PilN